MQRWLAIFCCLGLAGCASAAQMAQQDDATCRSYGATPGTDSYVQCRLIQQNRRDEDRRALAQGMQAAGQALSQVGRNNQPP